MGDYEDRGIGGVDDLQVSCKFVLENSDLPSCLSLFRVVNIIRYAKGSRNTACGHNDFCSVRLNGPI